MNLRYEPAIWHWGEGGRLRVGMARTGGAGRPGHARSKNGGGRVLKRSEANDWYVIRPAPKRKPWCRGPLASQSRRRREGCGPRAETTCTSGSARSPRIAACKCGDCRSKTEAHYPGSRKRGGGFMMCPDILTFPEDELAPMQLFHLPLRSSQRGIDTRQSRARAHCRTYIQ